jgi:hypothetical protein
VTIDKKCFLEFGDIKAVQITCKDCGAALIVPLAKIGSYFPINCTRCNADFMMPGTDEAESVAKFFHYVTKMDAIIKGRKFHMNLEIICPPASRDSGEGA